MREELRRKRWQRERGMADRERERRGVGGAERQQKTTQPHHDIVLKTAPPPHPLRNTTPIRFAHRRLDTCIRVAATGPSPESREPWSHHPPGLHAGAHARERSYARTQCRGWTERRRGCAPPCAFVRDDRRAAQGVGWRRTSRKRLEGASCVLDGLTG